MLEAAAVSCITVAVLLSPTARWRWLGVASAFLALSAIAVRDGPIYAPTRVFVWFAAYRAMPTYASLFRAAWVILAGASITLIMASWRLANRVVVHQMTRDAPTDERRPWVQQDGGPGARPDRTPRRAMARTGREPGRSRTI